MKSTINFGYLIFLSVVAALGGFLFGYDTAVISGYKWIIQGDGQIRQ